MKCVQVYLKMWIYPFDPVTYINIFPGCCLYHVMPGLPQGAIENTGMTSKAKAQSGPDPIKYISMCLEDNLLLWRESHSSKDYESQIFRHQYIALKHVAVRMKKEKSLDTYHAMNFI